MLMRWSNATTTHAGWPHNDRSPARRFDHPFPHGVRRLVAGLRGPDSGGVVSKYEFEMRAAIFIGGLAIGGIIVALVLLYLVG